MLIGSATIENSVEVLQETKYRTTIAVAIIVPLLSHVWLFATPWTAAHQASLSFTISRSLPKLMSTESVILSYDPAYHTIQQFHS